ncbi:MAG: PEP-utilizing enzyme [Acidimicrobiales bacterium]
MDEIESLEPYDDGRWTVIDHLPIPRFPLVCRGNTGEVYPNVVTPLTGSLVGSPFAQGQVRMALEYGMASRDQLAVFDGIGSGITSVFGGYLYGNVSLARSAVARTPGLTVDVIDRQMFGLSGAPPYRRGPGDRDLRLTLRAGRKMGRAILRPDGQRLANSREDIADYVRRAPSVESASDEALLQLVGALGPRLERMMNELLVESAFAGIGRSMLERLVADSGADGVVNRLTAGLGTIESAEPALELWKLSRLVVADVDLTQIFNEGIDGLDSRLRAAQPRARVGSFLDGFDLFRARHGSRGPDEWELASPTWGSDPAIGLAMIDRLRHSPEDRDPVAVGARLARERETLTREVRAGLPRLKRRAFDVALRATVHYEAQREATKAAFVRMLNPPRCALAELARRSGLDHRDFFLLTIDELPAVLGDSSAFADVIAERRRRREFLQARVPPFWFNGQVPPPHTWQLRAGGRSPLANERQLHGIGVCAGVATGTARVVTDPSRPGDLGPDDILVAPITDPAWTPLFLAVAGVVVDVGAQQSHAAIVARELGIPAAVSVEGASTTIPDGARVTVDGSTGTVTVHGPT